MTVTPDTGLAGKIRLEDLPAGQDIFYQVVFANLCSPTLLSEPTLGHLRTAPTEARDIKFVWSGDTAGQGWGINRDWGGMRIYNLLDDNVRAFNAYTPQLMQWDDHETVNNWYPGEILDDDRYTVKDVDLLAARARHAFLEWTPTDINSENPNRIYRKFAYGPLLEIFMLDMRSYRNANTPNREPAPGTPFLGNNQVEWLKQALADSQATWKIIASDMPVGLVVTDGDNFENVSNGDDGEPLGREIELAGLLSFIKAQDITNVVWLTADVHYTAAHHYSPDRAAFTDFKPFWEFVTGPLHAGTFGPNGLDGTFGPEVVFEKAPTVGQVNVPPTEGLQFFGEVQISAQDKTMTVNLRDLVGDVLYSKVLEPESSAG